MNDASAILLIHCPDREGLVLAVTQYISGNRGNIIDLDQHVDTEHSRFFMRVEWELDGFALSADDIAEHFSREVAERFDMDWQLFFSTERPRMAMFVSKLSHCFYDVLARHESGEWHVELPLIISNHRDLEHVADRHGVDFHHLPVDEGNREQQEQSQLSLLQEHDIDFIVLARYMQILSDDFVSHYPNRIINIHHSFLPAFPGGRPYHSAFERGVKIIGATSHFVTADLDAGPIISQDVVHISHRDTVEDMVRKGRDLEKIVFARAIWNQIMHKMLVFENRTVVFE